MKNPKDELLTCPEAPEDLPEMGDSDDDSNEEEEEGEGEREEETKM